MCNITYKIIHNLHCLISRLEFIIEYCFNLNFIIRDIDFIKNILNNNIHLIKSWFRLIKKNELNFIACIIVQK